MLVGHWRVVAFRPERSEPAIQLQSRARFACLCALHLLIDKSCFMVPPLRILVFLGSVRDSAPPRPARLGQRVACALMRHLSEQKNLAGELVDTMEFPTYPTFKPHFAHAPGTAPLELEALATKIKEADGYIKVTPEYNHSMSPALANLLNHFGSSLFSFKPSAIVTYSAGQWGGTRAAVSARTFLSELGCLPVSAMIHIPKAQEVLASDGSFLQGIPMEKWHKYWTRSLGQLQWWANAAKHQRDVQPFLSASEPFLNTPSARNAPSS